MKPKEYERLQARLTTLQDKKERQLRSGSSWRDGWRDAILAVKSMLHSEFKAEPVRHGHWIASNKMVTDGCLIGIYVCSECGEVVRHNSNYCPKCGAKMQEAKET